MLKALEEIQSSLSLHKDKKVSLADLIVLVGCVGIEQAAKNEGQIITIHIFIITGKPDSSPVIYHF